MVAGNKPREKELELIHEKLRDMRGELKKEKKGPGRPLTNQQMVPLVKIEQ